MQLVWLDSFGLRRVADIFGRGAVGGRRAENAPIGNRADLGHGFVGFPVVADDHSRIRAFLRSLVVGEHLGEAELGCGTGLLRPFHMCIALQSVVGSGQLRLLRQREGQSVVHNFVFQCFSVLLTCFFEGEIEMKTLLSVFVLVLAISAPSFFGESEVASGGDAVPCTGKVGTLECLPVDYHFTCTNTAKYVSAAESERFYIPKMNQTVDCQVTNNSAGCVGQGAQYLPTCTAN